MIISIISKWRNVYGVFYWIFYFKGYVLSIQDCKGFENSCFIAKEEFQINKERKGKNGKGEE